MKDVYKRQALPRAAACFTTPAMTRRAADWLGKLGGCKPIAILSDDCDDVVWQLSLIHILICWCW